MPTDTHTTGPVLQEEKGGVSLQNWIVIGICLLAVIWFYCFVPKFGPTALQSPLSWLRGAWNGEADFEHGILFPFIITGLIIYRFKDLHAAVGPKNPWALCAVFLGALFYVASYRTVQPRIAVGGLPFIVWGCTWYLWGNKVGKMLMFPLFFFLLAIPLPSFQQATVGLQLVATSLTHWGSSLCGVATKVNGTQILPVNGDWEPLNIASGCSGIRSLMALLMFSAAWAYIAKISLWKKVVLFLAAFPLAILGNAVRVTSIFVIAQYGDSYWASHTWHDWSGMLLFYPISLGILLLIHSLFEGGLPWKRQCKVQTTRVISKSARNAPIS